MRTYFYSSTPQGRRYGYRIGKQCFYLPLRAWGSSLKIHLAEAVHTGNAEGYESETSYWMKRADLAMQGMCPWELVSFRGRVA